MNKYLYGYNWYIFLSPRKETERNIPRRVDEKTPTSREKKRGVNR